MIKEYYYFGKSKLLFFVLFFINILSLFAQKPDTLWTRYYGATSDEKAFSVHVTQDSGFVLVGHTVMGNYKVYFIKTDEHGNLLWTKIYGGDYDKIGYSIDETTDGGFVIAAGSRIGQYGFWLLRTDCNGDTIWTRDFEGGPGYSAHQTADGGYIMGGGHIDHAMLIKTDSQGTAQWIKEYGNWNFSMCYSVIQTSDNGFLLGGYFGSRDYYLVKTDSLGDTLWYRIWDLSPYDVIHKVIETSDHYYLAVGGYDETLDNRFPADVYVTKFDTMGNMIWDRIYYNWGDDTGFSIIESIDGNYVIVGRTNSFGAGFYDFYIIKINPDGDTLWTGTYGTAEENWAHSIQQTVDGGYIIAGWGINPPNSYDFYLVRTQPDNSIEERESIKQFSENITIAPNPFRKETHIKINKPLKLKELGNSGRMIIRIFDVTGREVKHITSVIKNPNLPCTVTWDGRDDSGSSQPNGIYFIKTNSINCLGKKIILLR